MAALLPTTVAPPSDDKRWRIVDVTMRRHGYAPSALIEALHAVQESFGCLDEPGLRYVAASLRVPLSRVFGVATFYHYFSLKPQGDHTCVVCTGTACYIKDSPALLIDQQVAHPHDAADGDDPRRHVALHLKGS